MNYSNPFSTLEHFLLHKSFEQLNESERQLVLQEMTAVEYGQQRAVLLSAQQLKTEDVPDAPGVENILARVNRQQPKSIFSMDAIANLMQLKIPVWQVAVSTIVLGTVLFQLFSGNKFHQDNQPAMVQLRDTIYREVVVPLTTPKSRSAFAISTKMADSNYNLYLAFLKNNEPADIYFEKPMPIAPIEFNPPTERGWRRDTQGIRRIDSL